jgi:hypothetical protein
MISKRMDWGRESNQVKKNVDGEIIANMRNLDPLIHDHV